MVVLLLSDAIPRFVDKGIASAARACSQSELVHLAFFSIYIRLLFRLHAVSLRSKATLVGPAIDRRTLLILSSDPSGSLGVHDWTLDTCDESKKPLSLKGPEARTVDLLLVRCTNMQPLMVSK